jgi:hypothetical protein
MTSPALNLSAIDLKDGLFDGGLSQQVVISWASCSGQLPGISGRCPLMIRVING